jgi:hypothetical protein
LEVVEVVAAEFLLPVPSPVLGEINTRWHTALQQEPA